MEYTSHENVEDTGDGGLAGWLPSVGGHAMDGYPDPDASSRMPAELGTPDSRTVSAGCHCGAVQFTVRPADFDPEASRYPHSGFSDLLVPFAATDPAITANPDNVKWWLRPAKEHNNGDRSSSLCSYSPTRWLAGTCACRSCRLATGFEIQTWAFVPRLCIILSDGQPLAFDQEGKNRVLPDLSTYRSSPGVERNFCGRCGATVFWHDKWRPDVIDVSAGLLQSGDGAGCRVEFLLDWCTSRVSFVEEAPRERHGQSALRGSTLADSLEDGMKRR
ncbi:hypothetical protein SEUCBS139899_007010 [Sporothrix eucalyptigena]|uniref:CENP-V/GFA domain-containing protein n=1 Tax=Sporothrix eucalyptigena TaxID=1812306 RepID=A0ABP0B8P2_9PEZI